jgi:hypothetical protein
MVVFAAFVGCHCSLGTDVDVGCKLLARTRNKEYLSVGKKSELVAAMNESLLSMV